MRNRDYVEANGTEDGIDFDARYTVSGYSGVAWYLLGWAQKWESVWFQEGNEDWDGDEDNELVADTDQIVACMVGDDRHFTFDRHDISVIADDDYCSGCGQIGCKAYG